VWAEAIDDRGPARTGVTAIVPDGLSAMFSQPMAAGRAVLNGAGELTGSIEMDEWGVVETPIVLTSTNNVGRACDAIVDAMIAAGVNEVVIPVVGECDDSWLDDVSARHITAGHVRAALDGAVDGHVSQGVVGAGTGMVTMGFKAGIGTASRVIDGLGTVGVLLLCNFGGADQLRVGGRLVGPALAAQRVTAPQLDTGGSCLGVVMTDIPLDARQLQRVARRIGLGLARVGSVAHHGSGEIFCAVSTTNRRERDEHGLIDVRLLSDNSINDVFAAVVDSAEESVVNALFAADAVTGVVGHTAPGLPIDAVLELVMGERR